jgi:hypothetical protein
MDFYSFLIYGLPIDINDPLFTIEESNILYKKVKAEAEKINWEDKGEFLKEFPDTLKRSNLKKLGELLGAVCLELFGISVETICPYQDAQWEHFYIYLSAKTIQTSNTKPYRIFKDDLKVDTQNLKKACEFFGFEFKNIDWYLNFHIE